MEGLELWGIEEAAGVKEVSGNKVPRFLFAHGQVEASIDRAEGAIGRIDAAGGPGCIETGARGDLDDHTGLVAELSRGCAADHFKRLHGIQRNLVTEDLALLVGDGLAVYGKRVLRVIAEAMKEAVGIGRHARGGERHKRADPGGFALQRQLGKQVAVHVGVEGGVGLYQVSAGLDGNS